MNRKIIIRRKIFDPVWHSIMRNNCLLRSYQSEALRTIYDAALFGRGGRFAVMFPRQSGKNETQAQLEAALMAANQYSGGNIIKIIPTEKNQGKISTDRLKSSLFGLSSPLLRDSTSIKIKKDEIIYGSTVVRCLSASPNAAIVGATADILLEVDEAQMVPSDKFDREAAPMAAASNTVQVFWGTAWDDQTLLARETRLAQKEADQDGRRHVFTTTAVEVGREVPEYERFVRSQIELLSREHPAVRTQFFCEEITDLTAMFTADRMNKMRRRYMEQKTAAEKKWYTPEELQNMPKSDFYREELAQYLGQKNSPECPVLRILAIQGR